MAASLAAWADTTTKGKEKQDRHLFGKKVTPKTFKLFLLSGFLLLLFFHPKEKKEV
jgi:hypothetical protein